MKDVVVSINFEIELNETGYEECFYGSVLGIHCTDLTYAEMNGSCRETLCKHITNGAVILDSFSQDELTQLACEYYRSPHKTEMTLEDYSGVWIAKSKGYIYMSSDRKLSAVAMDEGVEAHGFLYAIELILKLGQIDIDKAASMIENYITRIRHYSKERAMEITTFMMRHLRNHAISLEDGFDLYEFMQMVCTSIISSANKTSIVR